MATAVDQAKQNALAEKDPTLGAILGLLLGPFAYIYTGSWGMFAASLLTLNFLCLGFIIVPIHIYKMIKGAKEATGRA